MNQITAWTKGIRLKLLVITILPLCALGTTYFFAYRGVTNVGEMLSDSYRRMIPAMDSIETMLAARNGMNYYLFQTLMRFDNAKFREASMKKLSNAWEEFKTAQENYEKYILDGEEKDNYQVILKGKEKFYADTEQILAELKQHDKKIDEVVFEKVDEGAWQAQVRTIRVQLEANVSLYKALAVKNDLKQQELRAELMSLLATVAIFSSLFLLVVMILVSSKLANGVSQIVSHLRRASEQVAGAIVQLSQSGQALSQSATQSAASLEETAASVEELSAKVSANTSNAEVAVRLSDDSTSEARHGSDEISKLISSMESISQSSKKIENIITVIDDIAFQTNLLALNASVEAARAGEQGKGFAVVAEAVRTLAQRSAAAAKDITAMIHENVEQVKQGSQSANSSAATFKSLFSSVQKVASLNQEIAQSSTEQSAGILQLSTAMNQMDQASQVNAASSEEIAATAEEIATQTDQMYKVVQNLEEIILGKAA